MLKPKKCNHEWVEDEMFASGKFKIMYSFPETKKRDTLMVCELCGLKDYKLTIDNINYKG
jgi:hypothetical protein